MFDGIIWSIIKSLIPEKNVLCGYAAGAIVFAVTQALTYVGVTLTVQQSTELSGAAAIIVAHAWDSVAKAADSIKTNAANIPAPPQG